MENYINRIYNLLYSPVVTPYNLLENAKLPNYEYVNYYKGETGLIAEMQCTIEEGYKAIFFYHFDSSDNLQKVFMTTEGKKELVFDRQIEVKKVTEKYLQDTKEKQVAV
jgi:hypothetical protein